MKGDFIERDDVLKEIWEWVANREYNYTNATHWLQKRIEAIPSAEDKADRKPETFEADGITYYKPDCSWK